MKTALAEIFGKAWRRGAVRWSGMNEATVSREIAKTGAVKPLWAAAVAAKLQLTRYQRAHATSQRKARVQKRAAMVQPPAQTATPRPYSGPIDFGPDPTHPAWEPEEVSQ